MYFCTCKLSHASDHDNDYTRTDYDDDAPIHAKMASNIKYQFAVNTTGAQSNLKHQLAVIQIENERREPENLWKAVDKARSLEQLSCNNTNERS